MSRVFLECMPKRVDLYIPLNFIFLMEITVNREETVKEIKQELDIYDENFTVAGELFKTKLKDYSKYVTAKINEGKQETLHSPPHPPSNRRTAFLDSIKMLSAHVQSTLVMDDHEYSELMQALRSSHASNTLSVASLNSLSY